MSANQIKIKLLKEHVDLYKEIGTFITFPNGDTYKSIPFWIKETEEKNVYEVISEDEFIKRLIDSRYEHGNSNPIQEDQGT